VKVEVPQLDETNQRLDRIEKLLIDLPKALAVELRKAGAVPLVALA